MKVLKETEISSSATSYRIEIEDEDLRTEETSEQRFERYLKQLRATRARRRQLHDDRETSSSVEHA